MKKLFVSVGLVAIGTASLQAAYAPGLSSMEAAKMWSVSATLRGFYDDNYTTAPSGSTRSSTGFEVSPTLSVDVPFQQTELGLHYTYGLYYYQDREDRGQNPIDQTHQADLWVDHAFTERWQAKVEDSFVVAQEPQLIQPGTVSTPQRVEGNNIRNTGTVSVHTEWTRLFSTELTYQNTFYDYQNHGATTLNVFPGGSGASLSGLLDRIEQSPSLDLQWQVARETMVFIGYQFSQVSYIGDEPIAYSVPLAIVTGGTPFYYSKDRDSRSYTGYVGFQHMFLENLSVMAKGGLTYSDPYADPLGSTSYAPYAMASATYTYTQGSYVQAGFQHTLNATDVVAPDLTTGKITEYQESSVAFVSINHQITPKLLGSLIGNWQYSTFHGGVYGSDADSLYDAGLNLNYSFNMHFSANAGYNFDYLNSGIPGRDYKRNRVYLGVSAAY